MRISSGQVELDADLVLPRPGQGVVLFAHGSGSGRKSPRNRQVAARLHSRGLGTLLLDLLTAAEVPEDELTAKYRFDMARLTERLLAASDWLTSRAETKGIPMGYFGASTGGAVAMRAAAQRPEAVRAIVLRGARSDLGDIAAPNLRCPTLLLVGARDPPILEVNARTMELLHCEKELVVVPGASHLFEESGALEMVAERATGWFDRYLSPRSR